MDTELGQISLDEEKFILLYLYRYLTDPRMQVSQCAGTHVGDLI